MAEESVRKEHVEAFTRRFDGRFLGVEKRMEQGFAHAEKARERNFVHLNQRFDSLERMIVLQNKAVLGILVGVVKTCFFRVDRRTLPGKRERILRAVCVRMSGLLQYWNCAAPWGFRYPVFKNAELSLQMHE